MRASASGGPAFGPSRRGHRDDSNNLNANWADPANDANSSFPRLASRRVSSWGIFDAEPRRTQRTQRKNGILELPRSKSSTLRLCDLCGSASKTTALDRLRSVMGECDYEWLSSERLPKVNHSSSRKQINVGRGSSRHEVSRTRSNSRHSPNSPNSRSSS